MFLRPNRNSAWFFDPRRLLGSFGPGEGPGRELGSAVWYTGLKDPTVTRGPSRRRLAAWIHTVRTQARWREFGKRTPSSASSPGQSRCEICWI